MKTELKPVPDQASAKPHVQTRGLVLQAYGTVTPLRNGLEQSVCEESVERLNQILVDTMTLRDLYKKAHWQVVGPTFYMLHLLFDKHYEEQVKLVDEVAERIQLLGGISLAMAPDVAEETHIPRPPRDREDVPVQLSRLLEAHEILLKGLRDSAEWAQDNGDDGTNDLLVSDLIRTNELQVWFLSEHLVDAPLISRSSD